MADHTYAELTGLAFGLSAFMPPSTYPKAFIEQVPSLFDVEYGGRGRVYGTVKITGTPQIPVSRRVRLIRDRDGICIREVWSDAATGAYEFIYVDETERYTVLAYDHTHDFRGVVADNLTPELMT
jgi:hypothetical protein